ncbi:hypothetical protein GCM10022233_76780 [Streptomyces shaanxiensis]|uniref:Uncharacterized protein n=1 Tax=Streptomyces shaanxiensis TaxID=653357 RepID=A0ABP7W8L5_9ACTN
MSDIRGDIRVGGMVALIPVRSSGPVRRLCDVLGNPGRTWDVPPKDGGDRQGS